jgi:hypothetical protein
MPRSAIARSCFRGLRKALHTHFRDESIRKGYEDARDLIADLFGSQPDVPITQDSLAGFLNGFLLACTQFATIEVSIHGVVSWCQCQPRAGSGGSQGFPVMASRMASSAVMPWAAAESR